ncbi:MAG: DEAD/DEAH box helicase family protein [Gammaproteobacteria bacterium]|nr:DEAD/DEAH box helicase family protein [Gammaproteobacteria bacterium]
MNKKELTEADIRTKFITPAIVGETAGRWDVMTQVREEVYFTAGRVMVRGKTVKRGTPKKADYVLYYKPGIPLAVVEAKDNTHTVGAGMQQALDYAEILDVPFAFSSNGDGFLEHDRTAAGGAVERELTLDAFPSPAELWARYSAAKGYTAQQAAVATQDYYDDGSGRSPRYYQLIAINRTVEAIARGENRILLVMATGTGKTYTAFQIIWRLWKSGTKKRILFLVDRNILANQTMIGDFKPFKSAMAKLSARNNSIEKRDGTKITLPSGVTQDRKVDKSFEIYLSLYQAVTGLDEENNLYKQFSPEFFDLIVVDECHRGSAADDSNWRQILEYFSGATQIGLTATPKETRDVSNIDYFGEPIYTYSLKQGIDDGFLAPYKVIRIALDRDVEGWRPERGKTDKHGYQIEDREYNANDFDRELVLEQRTELVAARITAFLRATDRYAKTIVFCENIDHAERMRQALVNANPDLAAANSRYVMRITGDNDEGKAQLDNFIDPASTFPVIATTSQLMSTGVDAQTCQLIVLDKHINSMTEFKQIIGRGTRINEDYGKFFFTIMDFKRATALFADPAFDGDPVQIYEPGANDPAVPAEPADADGLQGDGDALVDMPPGTRKYYVDDVAVTIASERVQYLDANGKLITESLKDYTRKTVRANYASLDGFLTRWRDAERKQAILEELAGQGVFLDELAEQVGADFDAFDLVCHVAFDQPPLTRRERAERVKKHNVFGRYGEQARAVLDALLQKYADNGIRSMESMEILKVEPLTRFGTPLEILKLFGGKAPYLAAIHDLEAQLYQENV